MIQVKGVHKHYQAGETDVHALRGVTLDITNGEFLSIAGPSGSGKTTLLNCIGCIDNFDQGTIFIEKENIAEKTKKQLAFFRRENLGFIFQTFNLIPVLSAFENISMALSLLNLPVNEVKDRTMQILKEIDLEGMENRRPARLSGGQQQRVAIARALVKNPSIILADEPTANLDSKTGEAILALMKKVNEKHGTTFIFSTHDSMVMDFADRLVQLHDGQIQGDERRRA